jgi:hypothetical protein
VINFGFWVDRFFVFSLQVGRGDMDMDMLWLDAPVCFARLLACKCTYECKPDDCCTMYTFIISMTFLLARNDNTMA